MTEDNRVLVSWVAREMSRERDRFIADLTQMTRYQIRSLDHDPRMVELLQASITEVVVAAIHFLEHAGTEDDVEAPTAAMTYARALAQRDVPLSALIRAYRIGHTQFVDESIAALTTMEPQLALPAVTDLVNRAARFIDRVCDQVGVAYEQERDRWVSSRSGLRQQWVNQLLDGAVIDISRAEDALEYGLDNCHIAVLVWPETTVPTRDAVAMFDHTRDIIANEIGLAHQSLMVPADERESRLWFALGDGNDIDMSSLRTALGATALPVRIAVGSPGAGLGGFRRTLRQAELAKTVALAGSTISRPAVFYREVAPVAMMAADLDELQRFVVQMLGDLAADTQRNQWLRDTLREFLARNRSFAATADAMFLHRNTVQYRVAQAMELCGHHLDDPDAMLNLQIALLACRWMGPVVLTPGSR